MKLIITVASATLFAFSQGLAARAKGAPAKLFACSVDGKQVSVTVTGERLVYHYDGWSLATLRTIGIGQRRRRDVPMSDCRHGYHPCFRRRPYAARRFAEAKYTLSSAKVQQAICEGIV